MAASAEKIAIRRVVPNDHSCCFWAMGYVAEGGEISRARCKELREVCAQDVLQDPDPATKALLLGANSVEEYADWIRNEFNWGGENEFIAMAKHYAVEVSLVCCETLKVMTYGSDNAKANARVYILYTGQHYDALVAGASRDVPEAEQQFRFPLGDASLEASALELAREHNREAARKAAQRRVKRIRCDGCQALLSTDPGAFQQHCSEVDHDDDFAYTCTDVEVVLEAGETLEGELDLTDADKVHCFYNNDRDTLSPSFAAPFTLDGVRYPTLEHCWQCLPLVSQEHRAEILAAPSPAEAVAAAQRMAPDAQDPQWHEVRAAKRLEAERARAQQNAPVAAALRATGDRVIVLVDPDPWQGMQAPGGIATGRNEVGKALMIVRGELAGQ